MMSVNAQALEDKLVQMYPEIRTHHLDIGLSFDRGKNAWMVHLKHGEHELATHLEAKDAEECLNGVKCVYLGVQIGQFIKNFETA